VRRNELGKKEREGGRFIREEGVWEIAIWGKNGRCV